MTPAYLRDMQIIDERLTALEDRLSFVLKILIKLETILLNNKTVSTEGKESERGCITPSTLNGR